MGRRRRPDKVPMRQSPQPEPSAPAPPPTEAEKLDFKAKVTAALTTIDAARIARVGVLATAVAAVLTALIAAVSNPANLAHICRMASLSCDVPAASTSPSTPPQQAPSPSGAPSQVQALPTLAAGAQPNLVPPNVVPPTWQQPPTTTPRTGGTPTSRHTSNPQPTGTGGANQQVTVGAVPPGPDGPHRGEIGWQPEISTDIDDIGFRHAGEGDIFAFPDAIRAENGVRIVRVRETNVGYARCRAADYHATSTAIAATEIQKGDYICADDGVQYVAAYQIVGLPAENRPYYTVLGTSWSGR